MLPILWSWWREPAPRAHNQAHRSDNHHSVMVDCHGRSADRTLDEANHPPGALRRASARRKKLPSVTTVSPGFKPLSTV